jgi:hypothetical protein
MTENLGWKISGESVSSGSKYQLDSIPLGGYSWPSGQSMQIKGTGFYISSDGPNPIVTIGSEIPAADGANVCGFDFESSSSSELVVNHIPPAPHDKAGSQTMYVTNFPSGAAKASTISIKGVLEFVQLQPSDAPFIPVIIENNSGHADDKVWIQFLNGTFNSGQTGAGGTVHLMGNKGYSLAQLKSEVTNISLVSVPNLSLNAFKNGRIYVNFGSSPLVVKGGNQPAPSTPSDPNYHTPYAYIEPFIDGSSSNNLDFSNIDFFSFAMTASVCEWSTTKNKYVEQPFKLTSHSTADLRGVLKAIAPTGAVVKNSSADFVRVNGPGQVDVYHHWENYMNFLEDKTTTIGGQYAGTAKTQAKYYNLTASFNSTTTLVTLEGTVQDDAITDLTGTSNTKIIITYAEMNAYTGVYGANPHYSINSGPVQKLKNDVYGWIVGDLLAGMNYGFPGSVTTDPTNSDETLGKLESSKWFEIAKAHQCVQFGGAQSNSDYYNTYAAANLPLTMAYGFPFTDRLGNVLLHYPPGGPENHPKYLKITIL